MISEDLNNYPSGIYTVSEEELKKRQPKTLGGGLVKPRSNGTFTHDLNTVYGDFSFVSYEGAYMFYENNKPVMLVNSNREVEWISYELNDEEADELLSKCIKAGYVIEKEIV